MTNIAVFMGKSTINGDFPLLFWHNRRVPAILATALQHPKAFQTLQQVYLLAALLHAAEGPGGGQLWIHEPLGCSLGGWIPLSDYDYLGNTPLPNRPWFACATSNQHWLLYQSLTVYILEHWQFCFQIRCACDPCLCWILDTYPMATICSTHSNPTVSDADITIILHASSSMYTHTHTITYGISMHIL